MQEVGSDKKRIPSGPPESLLILLKDWSDYLALQSVYSVSEELTGSHSTHTHKKTQKE